MEFRDGKPDDFWLLRIGYEYVEYDPKNPEVMKLMDALRKVQPIPENLTYLLKEIASASGCHTTDTFNILYGGGANAKSWLMGLVGAAFDVYGHSLNTSILANDISGEMPNPALADGQYKQFIEVQEAKKNTALNMEPIKN